MTLASPVEKPSLQSRHSLDSSKVQEKDKEAGPLWITLALQKQKGFREQQQTREERKTQREAKLAEKQARERESVGHIQYSTCKHLHTYPHISDRNRFLVYPDTYKRSL